MPVIIVNFNLSSFWAVTGGQGRKKGFFISDRNWMLFFKGERVNWSVYVSEQVAIRQRDMISFLFLSAHTKTHGTIGADYYHSYP